ncbi:MAG TPA: hypothetical protein PLA50_09630 [Bacteroidia bacterium]|nr:hypothetical protein [Bacteroidia bacterium]
MRPRMNFGERRAATLMELLMSMALLSGLMVVLALVLGAALDRFRSGTGTVEARGGPVAAEEWLRRDLAHHLGPQPMDLPRLPPEVGERQRERFENRLLLPFEINRRSGKDGETGFANAAPGFGSIAFVVGPVDSPAVVGYYVAYARHSPFSENPGAGMKLFRHFRRGGHPHGAGYTDGMLRYLSAEINDTGSADRDLTTLNAAAVRQGRFENRNLPFLFSKRIGAEGQAEPTVSPWPSYPVRGRLAAPPPSYRPRRGSEKEWADPADPVHDSVFPDEAICDHVVRFELRPFHRRMRDDGSAEWMDAAALNAHLGFAESEEWPALVAPDLVEVVIATVPEKIAKRMDRYEDWLPSSSASPVREEARIHAFRIVLPDRFR